jgi:drug/metabolite transporter (DMT)-like permease
MMLLSALLFSVMSAMVRGLPEIPSYVMVTVRFAVGVVAMAVVFVVDVRQMRWYSWPWIVMRGVSGGIAVTLFFWCIQNIGLAKAVLFSYTYMIFAAIFAVPILNEKIGPRHWGAIAVAMAGMGLLCGIQHLSIQLSDLVALSCGLFSGIAVVCLTKCRSTDSSANILWSQCIFGLAIVAWPAANSWVWPTFGQWSLLIVIALLATAGQLFMTYAYKFTGATYGSLLGQLTPVLGTGIAILYFKERPSASFFAGAILILVSCGYLSFNPVSRAVEETADLEE